jgi:hypothetical protein
MHATVAPPSIGGGTGVSLQPAAVSSRTPAKRKSRGDSKVQRTGGSPSTVLLAPLTSVSTVANATEKIAHEIRWLDHMQTMSSTLSNSLSVVQHTHDDEQGGSLDATTMAREATIVALKYDIARIAQTVAVSVEVIAVHRMLIATLSHPAQQEQLDSDYADMMQRIETERSKLLQWLTSSEEQIVTDIADEGGASDGTAILALRTLYEQRRGRMESTYTKKLAQHTADAAKLASGLEAHQSQLRAVSFPSAACDSQEEIRKKLLASFVHLAKSTSQAKVSHQPADCDTIAIKAITESNRLHFVPTADGPAQWLIDAKSTYNINVTIQGVISRRCEAPAASSAKVAPWMKEMHTVNELTIQCVRCAPVRACAISLRA